MAQTFTYTLTPWDYRPISSEVTYSQQFFPTTIYPTNPSPDDLFNAPLHLPNGAQIMDFRIQYCDTAEKTVYVYFQMHNIETGSISPPIRLLQSSGTPGCVVTTVSPPEAQVTIDNDNYFYIIQINLGGPYESGDSTTRIGAIRVRYQFPTVFLPLVLKN